MCEIEAAPIRSQSRAMIAEYAPTSLVYLASETPSTVEIQLVNMPWNHSSENWYMTSTAARSASTK